MGVYLAMAKGRGQGAMHLRAIIMAEHPWVAGGAIGQARPHADPFSEVMVNNTFDQTTDTFFSDS